MEKRMLIECQCPSCKKRFFVERDEARPDTMPPIAYQFGKKKLYSLTCGYCQRLSAAPAFAAWAEKHLAESEMEVPRKPRPRMRR